MQCTVLTTERVATKKNGEQAFLKISPVLESRNSLKSICPDQERIHESRAGIKSFLDLSTNQIVGLTVSPETIAQSQSVRTTQLIPRILATLQIAATIYSGFMQLGKRKEKL